MIIAFCPLIRSSDGSKKDTVINIERQKEFVVHICTEEIADKVNIASEELPYGQSEFEHAKLTPIPSLIVAPPRIKEAQIHFECRLRDILSYGNTPGAGQLITGEVLITHVDPEVYSDGKILTPKLKPIGRGAGNDWILCNNTIQLERKMQQQIQK
jgi:flavin reductase (DIM6/NTAB) family NADH-FMN oxidoreductase RutF